MARGELHIQLYVDYADDPKLIDVSRSARLLYVDGLCLAKRLLSDGFLTSAQLYKLNFPESRRTSQKNAEELVKSGAWTWDEQRQAYHIAGFLKRNKSRAQIAEERRLAEDAATLGNHRRWHVARGQSDPQCPLCVADPPPDVPPTASPPRSGDVSGEGSPARSDTPSPPGSGNPSGEANRVVSPELFTETETETETKNKGGSSKTVTNGRAHEPPPPQNCEDHEGQPNPPPCGACADARRRRGEWETERARQAAAEQSRRAHDQAATARAAIDACRLCGPDGKRDGRTCLHDPDIGQRTRRGVELAAAALQRRPDREAS